MRTLLAILTATFFTIGAAFSQSGVDVISASYGAGNQRADVTDRVKALVRNGLLELRVDPDTLGGDPAPGTPKTLRLRYNDDGRRMTAEYRDFDQIRLGRTVTPTTPAQNNLRITKAEYGYWADVTQAVQSQVRDGRVEAPVNDRTLTPQPPRKQLRVFYEYNGQAREAYLQEGEVLRLPGSITSVDTPSVGTPLPVGVGKYAALRIISAQWGKDSRQADVASLLQSMVQNDRLSLRADVARLGDPARGADKDLVVVYEFQARRFEERVREGGTLNIPNPNATGVATQPPANTPVDGVCFYEQRDFAGASVCVNTGQEQHRMYLGSRVGSVRFFGRVREVEVFDEEEYRGRSTRLTREQPDLSRVSGGFFSGSGGSTSNWADRVRSFRVYQ
jgi:hypothetical protein